VNATHNSITIRWSKGFNGGLTEAFRVRFRVKDVDKGYTYVDVQPPDANIFTVKGRAYSRQCNGKSHFDKRSTLEYLQWSFKTLINFEKLIFSTLWYSFPSLYQLFCEWSQLTQHLILFSYIEWTLIKILWYINTVIMAPFKSIKRNTKIISETCWSWFMFTFELLASKISATQWIMF